MNRFRMFFVKPPYDLQRMHLKLTKHGRFCKQKQLTPYQTHIESKDNSIEYDQFFHGHIFNDVFRGYHNENQTLVPTIEVSSITFSHFSTTL